MKWGAELTAGSFLRFAGRLSAAPDLREELALRLPSMVVNVCIASVDFVRALKEYWKLEGIPLSWQ